MSENVTIKGLTEQDVLGLSEAFGEPGWLRDRRLEAYKAFADLEWPHNRVEEWRHTNPRRFDLERALTVDAGTAPERRSRLLAAAAVRGVYNSDLPGLARSFARSLD